MSTTAKTSEYDFTAIKHELVNLVGVSRQHFRWAEGAQFTAQLRTRCDVTFIWVSTSCDGRSAVINETKQNRLRSDSAQT